MWNLRQDDDWSAIIKLHALIESAVTHLLVKFFGHPELEGVFAKMELGNVRSGKLIFLKELNCLNGHTRFIRLLSKLRNELVHDIRNVRFSLPEYVAKLDANQYKVFLDDLDVVEKDRPPRDWVEENAKLLFLGNGISCLAFIYIEQEKATIKHAAIHEIFSPLDPKLDLK